MSKILISAHLISIVIVGVFFALLLQSCAAQTYQDLFDDNSRRVIKVGVIFRDKGDTLGDDYLDTEIAFLAALERFKFEPEYEMQAIVKHVAEIDSFKTGQIGKCVAYVKLISKKTFFSKFFRTSSIDILYKSSK